MICDRCLVDKTVTVTLRFSITKIDRNGRESRVTISRRLCRACGGAEPVLEAEPLVLLHAAPIDVEADDQAELALGVR